MKVILQGLLTIVALMLGIVIGVGIVYNLTHGSEIRAAPTSPPPVLTFVSLSQNALTYQAYVIEKPYAEEDEWHFKVSVRAVPYSASPYQEMECTAENAHGDAIGGNLENGMNLDAGQARIWETHVGGVANNPVARIVCAVSMTKPYGL